MLRLLPALALLAWPSAGLATSPDATLSLHGPHATTFGHRVQFAGRLSPAVPGATIRLYRRHALVTVRAANTDGTYRIPVRLERPGPFHVEWGGVASEPVTVQVHPLLAVRLEGPAVVGRPLSVAVRLRPGSAGPVRVLMSRQGRRLARRIVYGSARLAVPTDRLGAIRIQAETIPAPGYAAVDRRLEAALRPPFLAYGSTGPAVAQLLSELAALHYAVPRIQATFDGDVQESVYAFQKVQGLSRTGEADAALWGRLEHPLLPRPRYLEPAAHIEVDKTRQVLYVVRRGEITLVSPVSTAGIPGYYTPVGRFAIYRKVPGYDPSPLGVLYQPMYFTGGYAIHGNPSVPPYPASHGCVRVPNFVIERLYRSEPYGEAVYVY